MVSHRVHMLVVNLMLLPGIVWRTNAFAIPRHVLSYHASSIICRHHVPLHQELSSRLGSVDARPFEECWKSNTWSVNPLNDTRVDTVLQRLCSPAPQSYFVLDRAIQQRATEQVLSQCTYLLKPGFEFQVKDDEWRIVSSENIAEDGGWRSVAPDSERSNNAVELAHEALDMATEASEEEFPVDNARLQMLVNKAKV